MSHFLSKLLFFLTILNECCGQNKSVTYSEGAAVAQIVLEALETFKSKVSQCFEPVNATGRSSNPAENEDVSLLVWENFPEAARVIKQMGRSSREVIPPAPETVLIAPDIGALPQEEESGKSPKIKKVITKIFEKKPKARIISLDWGKFVRIKDNLKIIK